MVSKRVFSYLVVVTLGVAGACAPSEEATLEQEVSPVRQVQIATRVYRKLLGRDPTAAEIRALLTASLGEMVDTALATPDFERDGFFGFHRDRLLLHRDGDDQWRKSSLNDYCALKLEMEEVAREDARGAGYCELLRYRDRWVGLSQARLGMPVACLSVKVRDLQRAMNPVAGAPPPSTQAQACARALRTREDFAAALAAFDPGTTDPPLVSSAPGKALLSALLSERLFKPAPGSAGGGEVALDGSGLPQFRVYDGTPNDRCTLVDGLGTGSSDTAFLKIRVPSVMEGVHGSMYFLSRHPSTQRNRDLHRARLIYFSYMCTEINPAMAEVGGGKPTPIAELEPYFDPADQHVRTSANCYNCHTQVQPIANYFGELTKGAPYSDLSFASSATSHFQRGDGFRRPGGLWKGTSFHEAGAGKFGMEGLADLLCGLDVANDCIARNAWSSLVGSGYPLSDPERTAAIAAFKGTDGVPRFARLLRHLAVDNVRGRAFLSGGEAALAAVPPIDSDCREVPTVPDFASDTHRTLFVPACAGCHSGNGSRAFYEHVLVGGVSTPVWKPERLVGPGLRYRHLAEFYHHAYCKVWSGSMPLGGWDSSDGVGVEVKKNKALCFLGGKRNEAARASDDPAIQALVSARCPGQDGAPGLEPHTIVP
jgi:hypothetical protein